MAVAPASPASPSKEVFDLLDTNHDGVITRSEWERASSGRPPYSTVVTTVTGPQQVVPPQVVCPRPVLQVPTILRQNPYVRAPVPVQVQTVVYNTAAPVASASPHLPEALVATLPIDSEANTAEVTDNPANSHQFCELQDIVASLERRVEEQQGVLQDMISQLQMTQQQQARVLDTVIQLEQKNQQHAEALDGYHNSLSGFQTTICKHVDDRLEEASSARMWRGPDELNDLRIGQDKLASNVEKLRGEQTIQNFKLVGLMDLGLAGKLSELTLVQEEHTVVLQGLTQLEATVQELRSNLPGEFAQELQELQFQVDQRLQQVEQRPLQLEGLDERLRNHEVQVQEAWQLSQQMQWSLQETQPQLAKLRGLPEGLNLHLANLQSKLEVLGDRHERHQADSHSRLERLELGLSHQGNSSEANLRQATEQSQEPSLGVRWPGEVTPQARPRAGSAQPASGEEELAPSPGDPAVLATPWPWGRGWSNGTGAAVKAAEMVEERLLAALEAEVTRRCLLITDVHARLAKEVAMLGRHIEMRWEELASRIEGESVDRKDALAAITAVQRGTPSTSYRMMGQFWPASDGQTAES